MSISEHTTRLVARALTIVLWVIMMFNTLTQTVKVNLMPCIELLQYNYLWFKKRFGNMPHCLRGFIILLSILVQVHNA